MEPHKQFIRDAGCKLGGPQLDAWSRGSTITPLGQWCIFAGVSLVLAGGAWLIGGAL